MPHEVLEKILITVVAVVMVGIIASIIIYYTGVGAVKADIIIERFELRRGSGIFTLRNVSNIKIVDVERLELQCSSKAIPLDKGLIPLPMLSGGSVTASFNAPIDDGDECRLYIEAWGQGGYRIAVSSALTPVKSI